jgi:DNA-binding response OmpR family regulator
MPQEIGVFARSTEVLLVDDEPQVRKFLANVLSRDESYHVMTASSGEGALDLSRNRSDRIDILITDIDMGKMSGIELYTLLREEHPETAVLFLSDGGDSLRELPPECAALAKPFDGRKFMARVAELLSASRLSGFRPSSSPLC